MKAILLARHITLFTFLTCLISLTASGQGTRISRQFGPYYETINLHFSPDGAFLISERDAGDDAEATTLTYVDYPTPDSPGEEVETTVSAGMNFISTIPIQATDSAIYYGQEHYSDPDSPPTYGNPGFQPWFNCNSDTVLTRDFVVNLGEYATLIFGFPFRRSINRIAANLTHTNTPLFNRTETSNGHHVLDYIPSPTRNELYFVCESGFLNGMDVYRYSITSDEVTRITGDEFRNNGADDKVTMAISASGDFLAVGVQNAYLHVWRLSPSVSHVVSLNFDPYGNPLDSIEFINDEVLLFVIFSDNNVFTQEMGILKFSVPYSYGVAAVTNFYSFGLPYNPHAYDNFVEARLFDTNTLLLHLQRETTGEVHHYLYYADFTIDYGDTNNPSDDRCEIALTTNTGAVEPTSFAVSPDRRLICYAREYSQADPNIFAIPTTPGVAVLPMEEDSDSDGIYDSWEERFYSSPADCDPADNDDGDALNNYQEFIADTDPTASGSCYSNTITAASGAGIFQLTVPAPTTNSRVYDAWVTTNLPSSDWTALGLDIPGRDDGGALTLTVTNTAPLNFYRTGVKIP